MDRALTSLAWPPPPMLLLAMLLVHLPHFLRLSLRPAPLSTHRRCKQQQHHQQQHQEHQIRSRSRRWVEHRRCKSSPSPASTPIASAGTMPPGVRPHPCERPQEQYTALEKTCSGSAPERRRLTSGRRRGRSGSAAAAGPHLNPAECSVSVSR